MKFSAHNNRMHSDSKKRRSSFLVALLFAAGNARRYARRQQNPGKSAGRIKVRRQRPGKPLQAVGKPERPEALSEAEPESGSGFVRRLENPERTEGNVLCPRGHNMAAACLKQVQSRVGCVTPCQSMLQRTLPGLDFSG